MTQGAIAVRTGRARQCVGITSRIRPWAAPPVSTKARMKAVGNEPACTLRRAGDERGPDRQRARTDPEIIGLAGEPGEPPFPAQIKKTKPVDFIAIGWSYRRLLRAPISSRAVTRGA